MTTTLKKFNSKSSITAIVACYLDEMAIPVMYARLKEVFLKNHIEYEIIFVDDASPDNGQLEILNISKKDPCVKGITHSRNFGSQASFMSGMELASMEACVLLDGDLQDPPEIIEEFIKKWREGYDVVYGVRDKREMGYVNSLFRKIFYRVFSLLSEFHIPQNAGDFSLIDSKVVYWIMQCKERGVFVRGIRAYVGFPQVGVNYFRPERMFGKSTNNLIKNIGWAKKGIFAYTNTPLHLFTALGFIILSVTFVLGCYTIISKIINPNNTIPGITYVILLVMFFGSILTFGIGILGEYIGKIFDESKLRPIYIRKSIIQDGLIKELIQ